MEEKVSGEGRLKLIKGKRYYFINFPGYSKDRISIETGDGEGGDFDPDRFFDVIDKFYKKYF